MKFDLASRERIGEVLYRQYRNGENFYKIFLCGVSSRMLTGTHPIKLKHL